MCSNPSVKPRFSHFLSLEQDFSEPGEAESLDDRQQVVHSVSRRRHHIQPADEIEMVNGYQAGSTLRELRVRFRVSKSRISSILKAHGVKIRNQSLEADTIALGIRLYNSGLSLAQVGSNLSCDANTVRLALVKAGVQRRDTHGRIP